MAWNKKAVCIASRTTLLPRKLNDRFEMPPLVFTPGHASLMRRTDSMKLFAYSLCSSIPVAVARTFGSKMMSVGSKPAFSMRSL